MHLVKESIETGLVEFDLMQGDEPYKYYWTTKARQYMELVICKDNISNDVRIRGLRLMMTLEGIRQYGLRELYSRLKIRRKKSKFIM